jgi:hypothetical protein
VQPQGVQVADQHAEDAAAARQVPDRCVRVLVDAGRDELLEPRAAGVDHTERGVPGVGDERRSLHDRLQNSVERQLRADRDTDLEQRPQAVGLRRSRHDLNGGRSAVDAVVTKRRFAGVFTAMKAGVDTVPDSSRSFFAGRARCRSSGSD